MATATRAQPTPPPPDPTPAPAPVTMGRVVHYRLDDGDVERIQDRRARLVTHAKTGRGTIATVPLISGNPVRAGDLLPLLVVAVHQVDGGELVSGQVVLDGEDTLWVTSRRQGDGPACWAWPERA